MRFIGQVLSKFVLLQFDGYTKRIQHTQEAVQSDWVLNIFHVTGCVDSCAREVNRLPLVGTQMVDCKA